MPIVASRVAIVDGTDPAPKIDYRKSIAKKFRVLTESNQAVGLNLITDMEFRHTSAACRNIDRPIQVRQGGPRRARI